MADYLFATTLNECHIRNSITITFNVEYEKLGKIRLQEMCNIWLMGFSTMMTQNVLMRMPLLHVT